MKSLKSVQFVYLRHFSLIVFKVFRHNGEPYINFTGFYGFVYLTKDPLVILQYCGALSILTPLFTVLSHYYLPFLFSDSVSASF